MLLGGARAGGERRSAGELLGVGISFAGVALLVSAAPPTGVSSAQPPWLGHGAILVASLSYAVGSLYARRAFGGLPAVYSSLAGRRHRAAAVPAPHADDATTAPLSVAALGSLLVLGLGSTALAYLITSR